MTFLFKKKKKYSIVLLLLLHLEPYSRQEHFRAQDEAIKKEIKHIKFIIPLLISEHSFAGFQSTIIKKHDNNLFSVRGTVHYKFTELQSTLNLSKSASPVVTLPFG